MQLTVAWYQTAAYSPPAALLHFPAIPTAELGDRSMELQFTREEMTDIAFTLFLSLWSWIMFWEVYVVLA